MSDRRGTGLATDPDMVRGAPRRHVIVAIGIDRYQRWPRLSNAVRDAIAATELFRRLGFEEVVAPLLNEHATGPAIRSLVTDRLRVLGPDDSLVLFYAGHGGTQDHQLGDQVIKTGYLIPVDASDMPDEVASWLNLEDWLRAVARLPAKHILVVLDACHAGIALASVIKWRDVGSWRTEPLHALNARRSRRIITSALDDQVALDSGPVYGHSLFTGCLIEGLSFDIGRDGRKLRMTTGSELGLYLQRRVQTYPESRQTPDFGTFAFDERGEMAIPLVIEWAASDPTEPAVAESTLPTSGIPHPTPVPFAPPMPAPAPASRPPAMPSSPLSHPPDAVRERGLTAIGVRRWVWIATAVLAAATSVAGYRALRDNRAVPDNRALPDNPVPVRPRLVEPEFGDCPEGMVQVRAGTFQMGSPDSEGFYYSYDERPQHQVTLSRYCIDRTEVTVKAYAACVASNACTAAPLALGSDGKLASRFCNGNLDDRQDHPINCIDWDQANAYCKWAGKRLPTEAEWEYAARGDDGRRYPWGNEPPSARLLNACGRECIAMTKLDKIMGWKPMYDASDGWETTAPVGSFPEGASPFGVLDMAGNVEEWTADWEGPYPSGPAMNPSGPKTGSYRVTRGAGWYSTIVTSARTASRAPYGPSGRSNYRGFRCAHDD